MRLNDSELEMILAAAARCELSVAGFLARAGLAAARDLDHTAAQVATDREVLTVLFDCRRRLGWAGSNLNQAARLLNTGTAAQLDSTIAAVHEAADAVREAAAQLLAQRAS